MNSVIRGWCSYPPAELEELILIPTPSDDAPAVLRHGCSDVEVAVVSMSARAPDGHDAEYLEWHMLDHLPEQYRINGMRNGTRWVSTPACRAARAATSPRFDGVDHVVQYLFAEPVPSALQTFFDLGADLRAVGRLPIRLPSVELAGYSLATKMAAARVQAGADVLPWRPTHGVYLLIAEDGEVPAGLIDVAGVAGFWTYRGSDSLHPGLRSTAGLRLTVAYLDDDPVMTAGRIAEILRDRPAAAPTPLLAAPFASLSLYQWDAVLPT